MICEIKKHLEIVAKFNSLNEKEIESFRINYIGKKGVLTNFFNEFKNVPKTAKKEYGSLLNNLKKDNPAKVGVGGPGAGHAGEGGPAPRTREECAHLPGQPDQGSGAQGEAKRRGVCGGKGADRLDRRQDQAAG